LSLVKLIVLIAVIAAVVYAFKSINRIKAKQQAAARNPSARTGGPPRRPGWARRVFKAEDLVECPRCGTYVRSLRDHECRRKG
jgi:hypothetical protein